MLSCDWFPPHLLFNKLDHYPHEYEHPLEFATEGAACFDIRAAIPEGEEQYLCVGETLKVATGLRVIIPQGYAMLIFSRSGQGFNDSIRLCNCVGVIDSDYRGELMVGLTADPVMEPMALRLRKVIKRGDRIAQGLLIQLQQSIVFQEVKDYDGYVTDRGAGGFGSTGH